jgi:alpha-glucosidase
VVLYAFELLLSTFVMVYKGLVLLGSALPALATELVKRQSASLDTCPGYTASNVQNDGARVTADLALAGTACNVYGDDLTNLRLEVEYQTGIVLAIVVYTHVAKIT